MYGDATEMYGYSLALVVGILLTLWVLFKVKPQTFIRSTFKWLAIIVITLINISVGIVLRGVYNDYSMYKPKKETELNRISLDMTYDDVLFIKGKPDWEKQRKDDSTGVKKEIRYNSLQELIHINWEERVTLIGMYCEGEEWKVVASIKCGEEVPIKRLESYTPIESRSDDNLARVYSYPELNLVYVAEQGRVAMAGVYNPEHYPKGIKFVKGE